MKEEIKGLYWAILISLVAVFAINMIMPKEKMPVEQEKPQAPAVVEEIKSQEITTEKVISVDEAINADKRVNIKNNAINGSIRLKGARFDDLLLSKYKQSTEPNSPDVQLLSPAKTQNPYYAEFGWLSNSANVLVPNRDTIWTLKGNILTEKTPVVLEYKNKKGLKFIRKISLDENYMFTIEDMVENNTAENITLFPYGMIAKKALKSSSGVVHEGIVSVLNGSLEEFKYTDIDEETNETFETQKGWAGFGDRYWFSAFILNSNLKNSVKFSQPAEHLFQADFTSEGIYIPAGTIGVNTVRFFAGAKEIELLDNYTEKENIEKFDLAIDFGWYYFLTKPFFYILDFLYKLIGNMGWAILLFATLLRIAMFPVANKSFESMSKMKKLQPKMKDLQERYKDDKLMLQKETMELYRKEKINPTAGCLPMFIQIPIFFSLYKVLNIAIEIRQAPFIGWIKDLSQPDPLTLSVITHLPIPSFFDIGLWPIFMGLTMFIQQKLNPAPTNKDQARVFALMPIIFTFMMGHFASGLVIYWSLSNLLSIIQQKAIMHKNGVN